MKTDMSLSDETQIPARWGFAILISCGSILVTTLTLGIYFGARDASASALDARVTKLEQEMDVIQSVDRRLARLEGAMNVRVPKEDRIPASDEY